jgi:hypothetical protein
MVPDVEHGVASQSGSLTVDGRNVDGPSSRSSADMFQYGSKSWAICRLTARITTCRSSSLVRPLV